MYVGHFDIKVSFGNFVCAGANNHIIPRRWRNEYDSQSKTSAWIARSRLHRHELYKPWFESNNGCSSKIMGECTGGDARIDVSIETARAKVAAETNPNPNLNIQLICNITINDVIKWTEMAMRATSNFDGHVRSSRAPLARFGQHDKSYPIDKKIVQCTNAASHTTINQRL